MTKRFRYILATSLALLAPLACESADDYEIANTQAIDRVWSGNFVRFAFLNQGEHQYVAYYDANRQMSIAYRKGSSPWNYYKVDSWYGWDSHNYITMELDSDGYLHLLGNMHADHVEYFRTRYPHTVRSLQRIEVMENAALEKRFTYPVFLKRGDGELVLKYRSGGSGDGNEIYLAYDTQSKTWSRLHESSLLDGEGLRNAYPDKPILGPDNRFHMVWIWRETPDAATNHDISYARSSDLIHWEDASGKPLQLPITYATSDIADPVPIHGGAINGNNKLGFDAQGRPLVAFHKFDAQGDTQVYLSRFEDGKWTTHQITDWEGFRWEFGGGGSLSSFEVRIQSPILLSDGNIKLPIKREGQHYDLTLDGQSLQLLATENAYAYPPAISKFASSDAVLLDGAETNGAELMLKAIPGGETDANGTSLYYLAWEAQAPFRGQAREQILPPSTLYLHTLQKKE